MVFSFAFNAKWKYL